MKKFTPLILIILLTIACELDDPLKPLNEQEVIRFEFDSDSIKADGRSSIRVSAILGTNSDEFQTIEFSISKGSLSDPGTFINSDTAKSLTRSLFYRTTSFQVNAFKEFSDYVVLSAEIGEFQTDTVLRYLVNYPNDIDLYPTYGITSFGVTDTVELSFVFDEFTSNNIPINWEVISTENPEIRSLHVIKTNDGLASAKFINTNDSIGTVEIRFTMDSQSTITKSINITFQ
ncbi:hypothetical protein [Ekhidna sp. To15]|uniref:hypothetical protein n=1 Tax=Ekhidna sp. To15 TaxID=3395267 RepID=UPI003F524F97